MWLLCMTVLQYAPDPGTLWGDVTFRLSIILMTAHGDSESSQGKKLEACKQFQDRHTPVQKYNLTFANPKMSALHLKYFCN